MAILGNYSRQCLSSVVAIGGGHVALVPGNLMSGRSSGWFNFTQPEGASLSLKGAAMPTGYNGQAAWRMPITGGEMSMLPVGAGTLAANLYPSKSMAVDFTGAGDLAAIGALVVSMLCALSGSGGLTAAIQGRSNMSADFTGTGDLSADLSALGNMIVALTGAGDLEAAIAAYGNMAVDIVVTGTGLSTANVGQSVWAALAASNNVPGSMGEKLNDAGSASNPWTEIIESGLTAAEILILINTHARELHLRQGLAAGSPLTVTPSSIAAGAVTQAITGDGVTTSTVTRT